MKRTFLFTSFIFAGVALLSVSTMINGCKSKTSVGYQLTGDTLADGAALVQRNCTGCHKLVPVNALSKDVWLNHTLPSQSHYLHISAYGNQFFKEPADTAGITIDNWQVMVSYYRKLAPAELPASKPPASLVNDWAGFTLKKAASVNNICFTTMVAANPATGKIYIGDLQSGSMTEWNSQLKPDKVITMPSPAVAARFEKDTAGNDRAVVTCIGRLDFVDFPNGKIVNVNFSKDGKTSQTDLIGDMPRPVQTVAADFNKDGIPDMVVLGQGAIKGGVYLIKIDAAHHTRQFTITERPGAVQAVTGDFNKDGWPDVMILFGTGNEGLTMFLNDHKGGFTQKDLLKFPPVYGSTSFQLADIDHDGNPDLIYTCGYNYHDSRILKPYHGLYIFKNTGNFNFKQTWFYPINGCIKAIAADFDGDGDLDIATSAFFADMKNNPAEEFIYFEQDKPLSFKPHAIPVSKEGRWMTMEVSDVNHDNKPDIILGNYASGFLFQPNFSPSWDEHTPFVVLENHTKK